MSRSGDLREWNPNNKKRVRRRDENEEDFPTESTDRALPTTEGLEADGWLRDDAQTGKERDYLYPELLKRIYDAHHGKKGTSGEGPARIQIEPPAVGKIGTRRVVWTNFASNCRTINRKPEHVLQFVLAELGTTADLGGDNKLVIRGRYSPKQLEGLLKKYIAEYVTCKTCHSTNTILKKENRIDFKVCNSCGSQVSVTPISRHTATQK
eukprot:TRINITY_DN247_c0_g1_i4.p1 TRINITY_DN247_c0_g1~~TRINITY_DN247_c0_g1_i4.p1  ORF type:complete len:209 (+),score=34.47 TRINITY_DN247_c0_g1_i4:157-783(+)